MVDVRAGCVTLPCAITVTATGDTEGNYDYLSIWKVTDLNNPTAALLNTANRVSALLSGTIDSTLTVSSPTGFFLVKFTSDGVVTRPGWTVTWSTYTSSSYYANSNTYYRGAPPSRGLTLCYPAAVACFSGGEAPHPNPWAAEGDLFVTRDGRVQLFKGGGWRFVCSGLGGGDRPSWGDAEAKVSSGGGVWTLWNHLVLQCQCMQSTSVLPLLHAIHKLTPPCTQNAGGLSPAWIHDRLRRPHDCQSHCKHANLQRRLQRQQASRRRLRKHV